MQTQAIISGPALDAGDQNVCDNAPVNDRDQRRYVRNDNFCDMGAYELGAAPLVKENHRAEVQNTAIFGQTYVAGAPCDVGSECTAGVFGFTATFCNNVGNSTFDGLTSRTRSIASIASHPLSRLSAADGPRRAGGPLRRRHPACDRGVPQPAT